MLTTGKLVAARVKRVEDPRLITGHGNYVSGMKVPGMLEMAILRSPEAHARIRRLEVSTARASPGVHMVLTGADIKRLAKTLHARPDKQKNLRARTASGMR